MTVAERYHNEAMGHLTKAKRAMKRLASASEDWVAVTLLDIEFRSLEGTCREFLRCQFGVETRRQKGPKVTG
jgi:hypothetical protein